MQNSPAIASMRKQHRVQWLPHLLLLALVVLMLYPLLLSLMAALKSNAEFERNVWLPPLDGLQLNNFVVAWRIIGQSLLISIVVSLTTALGAMIISAMAAYAFARFRFPGKELLYYSILSLMMVPWVLTLVPSFVLVKELGMLNTLSAQIVPKIAGALVINIFLLRSFIAALPDELFDATRIDGASSWQTFRYLVLPMSKAILGTVVIMEVLARWNDFIWPFITTQDTAIQPVVVALYYFRGVHQVNWGPLFAGYTIAMLPLLILFAFTSSYFIRGLSSGAIKA
jgi:ABC-type glycerol-3-phosphate transport system permease component